jgi:beta-1,4-mannosyl-glycoprotein beta-1,4-N-acetylglucosaminyltransferase
MKIYDSFLFFNELDLLEIRLKMLNPYVDYFVISECDYTFSGNKKPFFFDENKHLFSDYLHKIIHIKNFNSNEFNVLNNTHTDNKKNIFNKIIENYSSVKNSADTGYGTSHWCREYLHREYVSLGLSECNDNDIIISSDLDELPNPEIIKNINNLSIVNNDYCLYQDSHNYFVNNISSTNWMGSILTTYGRLKQNSLNNLRKNRSKSIMLPNGGWHLSFVGGPDRIRYKLSSYGHQEFNNDIIKSKIENKIIQNSDLFDRKQNDTNKEKFYYDKLKVIDIKGYYPNDVIELIKNKFPYLLK